MADYAKMKSETLWAILGDTAKETQKHKITDNEELFLFWYGIYKAVESELDARIAGGKI